MNEDTLQRGLPRLMMKPFHEWSAETWSRLPKSPVSAEECQRRLQASFAWNGFQLMLEREDSWQELTFEDFSYAVEFSDELVWVTDDVFVPGRSLDIGYLLLIGGTYQRTMTINGVQVLTIEGGSSREVALAFLIDFAVRTSYFVRIVAENHQELPLSEALMTAMVASGTVEHLELQNCHLNEAQSRVLALASTLHSLRFVKCTLSNDGRDFVEAMSSNQTPPALHIHDETNIDLASLGRCLRSNTSVKELSFTRDWSLEQSHRLRPVFEGLAANESILRLDLWNTKMDIITWMTMCSSLSKHCSLLYLNLRRTLPTRTMYEATRSPRRGLAAMLQSTDTIIQDEAESRLRALAAMLESNTIIQDINICLLDFSWWAGACHMTELIFARLDLNRFRARINAMVRSAHRNLEFQVAYPEEARYDKSKLYLLLRGNVDFLFGRNVA